MVDSSQPNGYVALTFDDGPNLESTPALLRALAAERARATFFVCGAHAARHPRLLNEIAAAGMWLGNHTYAHPHLTTLTDRLVHHEIARTQRIIQQITGATPTFFRPPYGDTNGMVHAHSTQLGLVETLWTVDSRDWAGANADEIVRSAAELRPGGILLLHDGGYPATVEAVPRILRELARRGLRPGKLAAAPNNGQSQPNVVAP